MIDDDAAANAGGRVHVDAERFGDVGDFLRIQQREARWWRDASLLYWQSLNGLALPQGARPPEHSLAYYQGLTFPEEPGHPHAPN